MSMSPPDSAVEATCASRDGPLPSDLHRLCVAERQTCIQAHLGLSPDARETLTAEPELLIWRFQPPGETHDRPPRLLAQNSAADSLRCAPRRRTGSPCGH